jgi:hypothetical protein
MIDGIEDLYQAIAESMVQTIPEDWSTATFEAIFYPDGSVYEGEYTRKADDVARSFQPATGGSRAFRQLRQRFKDAGKPLWGKARFDLRADGSFNMTWGYEDCDEDGNTLFDQEQELRRHEARRIRLAKQ